MDTFIAIGTAVVCFASKYKKFSKFSPGEPIRILLAGLVGTGNHGGDVRAISMIETLSQVLGKDRVKFSVMTMAPEKTAKDFPADVTQIPLSPFFYKDLLSAASNHHVALLAEGNCLKSLYSNAMTLFFAEAAGIMAAQGKPSFAYGCEAAKMDFITEKISKNLCHETIFIARTAPILKEVEKLKIQGVLGTDPAWGFESAPESWAKQELEMKFGPNSNQPTLGLGLMDPFCWPVRPSLFRWLKAKITSDWSAHFKKNYFYADSKKRRELREKYVQTLVQTIDQFCARHGLRVAITAEDTGDEKLCRMVASRLKTKNALFLPSNYNSRQWPALLRSFNMLVTSTYHSRVLSVKAGVPAIALSLDERLRNQFDECSQGENCISCYDEKLEAKLPSLLEKVWADRENISKKTAQLIPGYLEKVEGMAYVVRDHLKKLGWIQ